MSTTLLIKANCSQKLLQEALDLAKRMESSLSAYDAKSDVVAINKQAGRQFVTVSPWTQEALEIALEIAKVTGGKYDPTIGALSHFGYGFGWGHQKILDPNEARVRATQVDYRQLGLEGNKVMLQSKGMALDLGGIGKGFAVKKLIEFFKAKGVSKALVALGGEVYGYGKEWKVAVAHPRQKDILGWVACDPKGMAVTTSGDYERFITDFEHHHILNAQTGLSENLYSALTLVSIELDTARMDALNTAMFQMEPLEMEKFSRRYQLMTLHVDKTLNIFPSENFRSLFTSKAIVN